MDRHLHLLEAAPKFTWRRLVVTVCASAAVIAAGSYLVRAYPVSGYDAGYDAVMARSQVVGHGLVDAAGQTAPQLCGELHAEIDRLPDQPHYDYDTFVDGCRTAIGELYGPQIPATDVPG